MENRKITTQELMMQQEAMQHAKYVRALELRNRQLERRINKIENIEEYNRQYINGLKEALKKYGRHKANCKTRFIDADDPTLNNFYKECTCGFEEALKKQIHLK